MNCISSFGDSATGAVRDNPFSGRTNPDVEEKLITIYIHDEDLPRVHAILQCVRALFILYTRVAGMRDGATGMQAG